MKGGPAGNHLEQQRECKCLEGKQEQVKRDDGWLRYRRKRHVFVEIPNRKSRQNRQGGETENGSNSDAAIVGHQTGIDGGLPGNEIVKHFDENGHLDGGKTAYRQGHTQEHRMDR